MASGLSLKLYLNSLVYHRNVFGSSSEVFGDLRTSSEFFGNSRKCSGTFVWYSEQFWKIFGNLRKVVGNVRKIIKKRRHQHVYIIKRTLHGGLKIWILFCHSKIKFISSRHRVISSIYKGECLTGNETTRRFHTPLHPGPEWRIFRMSPLWVSHRSMTSRFPPFAFVELVSPYNKKNYTLAWRYEFYVLVARTISHSNIKFISSRHRVISFMHLACKQALRMGFLLSNS